MLVPLPPCCFVCSWDGAHACPWCAPSGCAGSTGRHSTCISGSSSSGAPCCAGHPHALRWPAGASHGGAGCAGPRAGSATWAACATAAAAQQRRRRTPSVPCCRLLCWCNTHQRSAAWRGGPPRPLREQRECWGRRIWSTGCACRGGRGACSSSRAGAWAGASLACGASAQPWAPRSLAWGGLSRCSSRCSSFGEAYAQRGQQGRAPAPVWPPRLHSHSGARQRPADAHASRGCPWAPFHWHDEPWREQSGRACGGRAQPCGERQQQQQQ